MVIVSGSENVNDYRSQLVKLGGRYAGRFDAVQCRGIGFGEGRICLGFKGGGAPLERLKLQNRFAPYFVKGGALKGGRRAKVTYKVSKVGVNTDPLPYVLP